MRRDGVLAHDKESRQEVIMRIGKERLMGDAIRRRKLKLAIDIDANVCADIREPLRQSGRALVRALTAITDPNTQQCQDISKKSEALFKSVKLVIERSQSIAWTTKHLQTHLSQV